MCNNKFNAAVLIPAYQPDEKLTNYVKELVGYGFQRLIIVNDGSSEECNVVFDNVRLYPECVVLSHEINRGKGCALKTGISWFIENCPDMSGVITADADGQHKAADAAAVAELMNKEQCKLILGVRDFSDKAIPTRSRFGNKTTSAVFKATHGVYLSDTQTGLRGIPRSLLADMLLVKGDRYEYEMNVLIECADRNIPIAELPIETIYIDDNASSHFRPVRDSIRIYSLILKKPALYILSSLSSFLIDIALFSLISALLPPALSKVHVLGAILLSVLIATVGARLISSLYNFFVNQRLVFKQQRHTGTSLVKYYCLCAAQALASSLLVSCAIRLLDAEGTFAATVCKCIVDTLLFLISYQLQRIWVFGSRKDRGEKK